MKYFRFTSLVLVVLFVVTVILPITSVSAVSANFKDVKSADWFYKNVIELTKTEIISGYPDGSFKPQENIQVDALIKLVITALGHKVANGKGYWAEPYIAKAKELGIVEEGDFKDYKSKINRGQMAKIVILALKEGDINYDDISSLIGDYNSIPSGLKSYISKAYLKGIITGYPDKTFKPDRNTTRAEATTIIVRMLDKSKRVTLNVALPSFSPSPIGNSTLSEKVIAFDQTSSEAFMTKIENISIDDAGYMTILLSDSSIEAVKSLKKGDIFLVRPSKEYPQGFLGKVESYTIRSDNKCVLKVVQPDLTEAFSNMSIKSNKELTYSDITSSNLAKGVTFDTHPKIFAAGPGFSFGEIFKSLNINTKQNLGTSIDKGTPVYDELSLNIKDATIYDEDGNDKTTKDQIKLNAKLALTNASLETNIDFDNLRYKRLMARFISTPVVDVSLKGTLLEQEFGIDTFLSEEDKKTKKLELGVASIEGLKRDKNKIILGNITFDLGTMTVVPRVGDQITATVGATVFLTMTFGGKVSAEVSLGAKYSCYLEKGFDITYEGGQLKTKKFDVFAAGDYPNPNVTRKPPTEEQKNSRPKVELTSEINGALELNNFIGGDVGIYVMGIVPAKITNDFGLEMKAEGKVSASTKDGFKFDLSGTMDVVFKGKLMARIAAQDKLGWVKVEKEYSMDLYRLVLKHWEFKPFAEVKTTKWINNPVNSNEVEDFRSIVNANGKLVALGGNGYNIYVSEDFSNFKKISFGVEKDPEGVAYSFNDITYNNSRFVIVGDKGKIFTSLNGIDWVKIYSDNSIHLLKVNWDGSKFIAVGSNGSIVASVDGTNWQKIKSGLTEHLRGIKGYGSQYVIVGNNGAIITSPTGNEWTNQKSGTKQDLFGVASNNISCVAVGDNIILNSYDGIVWVKSTYELNEKTKFRDVSWDGKKYVAVGENGTILSSADGEKWVKDDSQTKNTLYKVIYDGEKFIAVGGANTILTSIASKKINPMPIKVSKTPYQYERLTNITSSFYSNVVAEFDGFYGGDGTNDDGPPKKIDISNVINANKKGFAISLPTNSNIVISTNNGEIIDVPDQNDIFIEEHDDAGEVATVYVSDDNKNYVKLGYIYGGIVTGLDLASINYKKSVKFIKVVGNDNRGSWPGYDLMSVIACVKDTSANINKVDNTLNGHKYSIIDKSMSWLQAKTYCESLGGYLVTITSAEEEKFIETLVNNGQKKNYWIGASDEVNEGTYQWITGEPFTYSNWEKDQPNNYGVQNYVLMQVYADDFRYKWNDAPNILDGRGYLDDFPLNGYGFICEWNN